MSIINDAIKKAIRESGRKSASGTAETMDVKRNGTAPSSAPSSSETKWVMTVVVSLAVIASLFGSVFLYKSLSRVDSEELLKSSSASLGSEKNMPPLPASEKKRFSPSVNPAGNHILLNGIVYGPDDKWAIINDRIVREGDSVMDGKLVLIKKDFVRIERPDGEEVTLDLR